MHPQPAKNKIVSFLYLKVFLVALVVIIIASLGARIFSEFSNSSFKHNSFTILYFGNSTFLLNVDKKEKRYTFVDLGNLNDKLKGKNTLEMSLLIGAPVNATIQQKNAETSIKTSEDFLTFSNQVGLMTGGNGAVVKRMNSYDVYKFISSARGALRENRFNEKIPDLNKVGIDKELSDLLRNTKINEENTSIEVINGTGINGLASVFSQMLANGGYNIIDVRSDNSEDIPSEIRYKGEATELTDSLVQLTSFQEKNTNPSSTADVTIYLGNDLAGRLSEIYD